MALVKRLKKHYNMPYNKTTLVPTKHEGFQKLVPVLERSFRFRHHYVFHSRGFFLTPHSLWEPTQGALWKHIPSCLTDPTRVKCHLLLLFLLAALVRWGGRTWVVTSSCAWVSRACRGTSCLSTCRSCRPSASNLAERGADSWNGFGQFLIPWKQAGLPEGEGLLGEWCSSYNPLQLPHSAGRSTRQKKHPWEPALIFGGWQPLLHLSCLSSHTMHPWRGQICSTITPHFSHLPAEPCYHLCELLRTDSLPWINTIT